MSACLSVLACVSTCVCVYVYAYIFLCIFCVGATLYVCCTWMPTYICVHLRVLECGSLISCLVCCAQNNSALSNILHHIDFS